MDCYLRFELTVVAHTRLGILAAAVRYGQAGSTVSTRKTFAPPVYLPGSQLRSLIELVSEWGFAPEAMLTGTALTMALLERPDTTVSLSTYDELVSRARALTGEPALGIYMGMRRRLGMYGLLGFAALTAGSLREVLENADRFLVLATTALRLHFGVEGDRATVRIEELVEPGANRDAATFALLVSLTQCLKSMTGVDVAPEFDVVISEPVYYARFAHVLPTIRFDQPSLRVSFAAKHLDLVPIAADRVGQRLAIEHCERELHALALRGGFIERVRALCSSAHGMRSLKEVAVQLDLSPRTLNRRLAEAGVQFADLLKEERMRRAHRLLRTSCLPLHEIAAQAGYATLPSFARAFRRWTGQSPDDYRRREIALEH